MVISYRSSIEKMAISSNGEPVAVALKRAAWFLVLQDDPNESMQVIAWVATN